ncbi:hypothetical protein VUR80DRAFT_9620 [Thermomyces stellatus]
MDGVSCYCHSSSVLHSPHCYVVSPALDSQADMMQGSIAPARLQSPRQRHQMLAVALANISNNRSLFLHMCETQQNTLRLSTARLCRRLPVAETLPMLTSSLPPEVGVQFPNFCFPAVTCGLGPIGPVIISWTPVVEPNKLQYLNAGYGPLPYVAAPVGSCRGPDSETRPSGLNPRASS